MSTTLLDRVDMLEVARVSTAARVAAETGADLAVEHHDEAPSTYGAKVAARMVGLYGWHLAAETAAWAAYASPVPARSVAAPEPEPVAHGGAGRPVAATMLDPVRKLAAEGVVDAVPSVQQPERSHGVGHGPPAPRAGGAVDHAGHQPGGRPVVSPTPTPFRWPVRRVSEPVRRVTGDERGAAAAGAGTQLGGAGHQRGDEVGQLATAGPGSVIRTRGLPAQRAQDGGEREFADLPG